MVSSFLLFFFLIIRRPPRSTLFPTRRSSDLTRRCSPRHGRRCQPGDGACTGAVRSGGRRHRLVDRKSTRLNSSHVEISYAVFCLKKKKTKYSVPTYHI